MEQRLILITQLVKLGVAAAIASALVRSVKFKSLLFKEQRTLAEKIHLVLFIGTPFALGVMVRFSVKNFLAADMAFEATILMGVIGGRVAGVLGGAFVSLPAMLHGEWATLPFNVVAGVLAGMLRNIADDRENIWSFSPFIDLSVYRWIRRNLPRPKLDWQIMFFVTIFVLRLGQQALAKTVPGAIFSVDSGQWGVEIAVYATTIVSVAIALKIWNNTRTEMKLEEQHRLLLQARMAALQSQINPHFLFNTLNSVSSLVRFDPDTARNLIIKLANILRRLLRSGDAFVPLREELEFIDDYLDIEVVRFGHDKLNVIKDLDPASLDVLVPGMLLQPLVENSIKHGLSAKIDGGSICLRSKLLDGMLHIEVEDDGVGMGAANLMERPSGLGGSGIGMANVAERLKVLYGDTARMVIDSHEGKGTSVRIKLPALRSTDDSASGLYELRSTTRR
ncbi:MAG TPA: histidine kinase [Terriglobales bacterium]|nr:histidine kinase [Terriglobales bacterium]